MIKKILKKLIRPAEHKPLFTPSELSDPVAEKTEWIPLKRGGVSFCTHNLVQAGSMRYEFRLVKPVYIFFILSLLLGAATPLIVFFLFTGESDYSSQLLLILSLSEFFFLAVGAFIVYTLSAPRYFDKERGYFYRGRKNPEKIMDKSSLSGFAYLSRIHALQIISERVSSNNNSYSSYELNLVLRDSKRINIVDHSNLKQIRDDAKTLSEFMGLPVWDAEQ